MRSILEAALTASAGDYKTIRFQRAWRTQISFLDGAREFACQSEDAEGVVRCLGRAGTWASAAFRAPSEARQAARQAAELSLLRLGRPPVEPAPLAPREASFGCDRAHDPRGLGPTATHSLLQALGARLSADPRVIHTRIHYEHRLDETWLLTSDGVVLREERPEISIAALVVVSANGSLARAADSIASPGEWQDIEHWASETGRLPERAVARLHAAPLRPGRYPVILAPCFAAVLAHRAIGHSCLAGSSPEDPPLALGTRIGPEHLDAGDDGTAPGLRGTHAFDHEGTEPRHTVLLRHGVIVAHLHTRASALVAEVPPTGNARAEGAGPPGARLANTYIANGQGSLEDLLRGMASGVYLSGPESAVHAHGRLVMRAAGARMIRGGELAEPLKGAALAGDPAGLLGQVDAAAGDFQWDRSASRCEGPTGWLVPVTTGAPHLRLVDVPLGRP